MNATKISVVSTIDADLKKVWEYFTFPEHIVKWNHASDDWHCPFAENDVRKDGKFKFTMASIDGKISFDFEGVYSEVLAYSKISYGMPDGRQVQVVFENKYGKTIVKETFDPENMNSEELQRAGWQSILDNFRNYVESN